MGQKLWDIAPKEYHSTATLRANLLKTYEGKGNNAPEIGIRNPAETATLRDLESVEFLSVLADEMELEKEWGMQQSEVIVRLRDAIRLEFGENSELYITINLSDPIESHTIVKAMAPLAVERIEFLNEQLRKAGQNAVEERLHPFKQAVSDARTDFISLLRAYGVTDTPVIEMDLSVYNNISADVLPAGLKWEDADRDLKVFQAEVKPEVMHWMKTLLPTSILQEGELPTEISGPDLEPFQSRGMLVGLSLGLILGLLAQFIFWKLFS